jgi:phosphoadenosine phosphosulfate reductase
MTQLVAERAIECHRAVEIADADADVIDAFDRDLLCCRHRLRSFAIILAEYNNTIKMYILSYLHSHMREHIIYTFWICELSMTKLLDQTTALLREAAEAYAPSVLASSLGAEDMVLLDLIAELRLPIGVFTLDTGRLPQETYDLLQLARARYGLPIAVYAPDSADVERYMAANGPNGFYDSVELRRECCFLRKVKPLKRALAGKQAWIAGLRRAQSDARKTVEFKEWDADNGLYKFNPLADWSEEDVWAYLRTRDVPVNALHAKGYPSIGCAPCTRAVAPGEDPRAGRWWWENPAFNECGLHLHQKGKDVEASSSAAAL